jgi:hypothetical protein
MKGRKKKRTGAEDCIAVKRLFQAVGINPKHLIAYLEGKVIEDEVNIAVWRKEAFKFPDLEKEVVKMEIENTTAQLLVSVLKIALMEGRYFNYVNPSLN